MTSPSKPLTTQQHISLLRHLAGGKDLETVAQIMQIKRDDVFAFAHPRGYPDSTKLTRAADLLAKKAADDELRASIPTTSQVPQSVVSRPATTSPSSITSPTSRPGSGPDEIRVLLNAAKSHPSKRIQTAADRVFDALDRLRGLIREDDEKNASRRREDAAKAAARAEVERLERELAAAKAKLRGKPAPAAADRPAPTGTQVFEKSGAIECDRDDCDRTFATPQAMRMHQRRAHEGFDPNAAHKAAS